MKHRKRPILKFMVQIIILKTACIRDYIHVLDISEIHYKVLLNIDRFNTSSILNCGYGKGISVNDAIKEFKK